MRKRSDLERTHHLGYAPDIHAILLAADLESHEMDRVVNHNILFHF